MNKNIVPIITWKPWNPVDTKKVEPYTESAIQKGASKYSKACSAVNIKPKKTVKDKPLIASSLSPLTILWWAQVTVAPELNKTAVFNKGTEKGFKGSTPKGGQHTPISIAGDKLLWKNAQKNDTKNNTSETINNKNPIFNPLTVAFVWNPWNVDSLTTSLNHKNIQIDTDIKPKINIKIWL